MISEPTLFNSVRGAAQLEGLHTVLLVEDEAPMRDFVKFVLERFQFQVIPASSGVEALGIWEKARHEIDLLLTDIVMPGGVSGQFLGRRLGAEKPGLKVIYMSGHTSDSVTMADLPIVAGQNFLQKPFLVQELLDTVRAALPAC
jgi:two-component system cell cycle sensor histidine kinase/response regulator CckA